MILDENMEMEIIPIKISYDGDFAEVTTLVFDHPLPTMAKSTFKMRQFFIKIQNESQKVIFSMEGGALKELVEEGRKQKEVLTAGEEVKALHEEYADGSPEAKEAKLKEIEALIEGFMQMINMCEEVDFYKMTVVFGRLILDNKRCKLKRGEDLVPLTETIWEQQIVPTDRLKAAVRYCCFFGLTSNAQS